MDFKEFLRYGCSSVALLIAGASAAQALTVTQTINVNSALTQSGGAATGQFDITGLLTPSSSFNQPYDIVSATVTAYGYSAPDTTTVTGMYDNYQYTGTSYHTYSYTYSYSCGWSGTCYGTGYSTVTDYHYNVYRTKTNLDNVADTLDLSTGGDTFSGTVTGHDTSVGPTNFDYSSVSGTSQSGYYYYNYYTTTVNDILSGALSAGGALSPTALADLAQDGLLSFSVDASVGQFTLQSLTLDVTVNENAAQGDIATPEPAPIGSMSAGLLLLMLYRRLAGKRRRDTEA